MEIKEYKDSQVFILESEDYIEFEDMRTLIDDYKRFNKEDKGEIILLKEGRMPYTEYISNDNGEDHIEISMDKDFSLKYLEKKYSLN